MKRTFYAALAILLSSAAFAQTRWYASDPLGNPLREIGELRKPEYVWLLSVSLEKGVETRVLYKDGSEQSRVERSSEGEKLRMKRYTDGKLSGEHLYDNQGALIEEASYEAGQLKTRLIYEWLSGRVEKVMALGANGALLYEDRYTYSPDGSLREHSRVTTEGSTERSRYDTRSGVLIERSYARSSDCLVFSYTPSGRIEREETWIGQSLVALRSYNYRDRFRDEHFISSEEIDYRANTRITREYDEEGRLSVEAKRSGGILVSVESYEYEGGFLSRSRLVGQRGEIESREYERDGSGRIIVERLYQSGALARVARYKDGELAEEEIWSNGRMALKAFFDGGKRVREEPYPASSAPEDTER